MGVVINIYIKYPGGRTRIKGADIYSCYKFITISLLKRLLIRNGRFSLLKPPYGSFSFRSETATWIQKWLEIAVGASRKLYT
jgi:hypothetical protein